MRLSVCLVTNAVQGGEVMSGGSMDYVSFRISDAARHIQRELANVELCRKNKRFFDVGRYYKEEHPDVDYLKSPEALTNAVIKRLQDALMFVRKASIYAHRVEWLTSGDDGYENFCMRLDEQLAECEKHGGV
jgi:hypothetical protein